MASHSAITRGGRRWPAVAYAVADLAEQALADPDHPWTRRWPTSMEMAGMFGTTQTVVLTALNYLHEEGVLVKAWVQRGDGLRELWVPRKRALGLGPRPTRDQIAAEIVRKGVSEQWAVLPSKSELAEHFHVSTRSIDDVMRLLVQRRQAIKIRVGASGCGGYRWRIVRPHELRSIDPRLTMPSSRVVVVDLIRRIRAGEFRYRLPDGSRCEQPFPSNRELSEHYRITTTSTVAKVKKDLIRLGWIEPGERRNVPYRLTDRVPTVDRATHPSPRNLRPRWNARAQELADDLRARIQAGEFRGRRFSGLVETMTTYHASKGNVRAAFSELEQDGWITFRGTQHRRVVLADPLPDSPGVQPCGGADRAAAVTIHDLRAG